MTTSTFDTPGSLAVDVTVSGGTVLVTAADTDVTVVTIEPLNPEREADVRAAEETVVECDGRSLRVSSTRRSTLRSWFGTGPAIRVTLDVPAGSRLAVDGWADTTTTGPLGDVTIESALGNVSVERAASVRITSAMGDIRVGDVDRDADLKTSAGAITTGSIGGHARLKTSAGDLRAGSILGTADLRTAAGDVSAGTVRGELTARTSAGSVRVDRAVSGVLQLQTSYGAIEVGVPHGTAAWLDTDTRSGKTRTDLDAAAGPSADDHTVEIHASTKHGDVHVRRAPEEDR